MKESIIRPILNLKYSLIAFFHSISKHCSKMFTLSKQYCFMCKYFLSFNLKHNVWKYIFVDYFSHVRYKCLGWFSGDFIDFHLSNIEDTDVVEPFAAIKATKYEQLLGSNYTSCMSLSSNWGFFDFLRMTPSHVISVKNVKIIRRNNLFEGSSSSIITSKEINFTSD